MSLHLAGLYRMLINRNLPLSIRRTLLTSCWFRLTHAGLVRHAQAFPGNQSAQLRELQSLSLPVQLPRNA